MLTTVTDHGLIGEGDRILVAVSGGKDSYTLLDLLERARKRAPVRFELQAFHLDQRQPGYDGRPLEEWLEASKIPFEIGREDTYSAVMQEAETDENSTYCRLCSRDAGSSTPPPIACAVTRSRWDTIATIRWRPCCSTCSTPESSRRCPRATRPMTAGSRSFAR